MSVKLSISHLQMIQAIADCGTVSSAARRLHITQPALSHRIRKAEHRLGIELFHRKNNRLSLSKAGNRLLHMAVCVLEQIECAEHDIEKMQEGIDQVIRIGARTYSCYHWLPVILKKFRRAYPKIDIEIITDAIQDPLRALERGAIDLAIVSRQPQQRRFNSRKLFDDEMLAVLPAQHPLADKKFLTPMDFASETYIANDTTPERGREYDLFFSREDVQPKKLIQAGLTEAIIELVRAHFGITILTRWVLEPYLKSGDFTVVPLTQTGLYAEWYAATLHTHELDSPILLLANELSKRETV